MCTAHVSLPMGCCGLRTSPKHRIWPCRCTTDNDTSYRDGLQLVQQGQPCLQMQHPEPIGFVQARTRL